MSLLKQHIEALIFCSEQTIALDEIMASLKLSMGWEVDKNEAIAAIEEIKQKYQSEDFAFALEEIAEGYQFLTKKEFHSTVSALIQHKAKKRLSVAQMETLAVIAYKQPVSKSEIEHIRGVNCDYAVQKLLEKDLIEIQGKSEGPGKPIIYATSQSFMDYFGIKSVKDLPQLKDLHAEQNEIGVANDLKDEQIEEVLNLTSEIATAELESTSSLEVEATATEESSVTAVAAESEETFITDENPSTSELPDRKTIFLEHEESKSDEPSGEITSSNDEDEQFN